MIRTDPKIELQSVAALRPYPNNARRHSKRQVKQIAESIRRFGFTNPVLVSGDGEIIAGHGRVEAAKLLGLGEVPTLALSHLTAAERRAYVLADNKLALNAGWDAEVLAIELQGLIDLEFDVSVTGFSLAEVDLVLDAANDRQEKPDRVGPEDKVPPVPAEAVTRRGDCWSLGRHRLVCGDAREGRDYATLLGNEKVDLVFTDPPYNVKIDGHVCGLGEVRHREFAFASGEMSADEFTSFLTSTLKLMAGVCRDGAIAFVCMDWRHMHELLVAGAAAFTELKNLCVWNKTNGGMGTFYRSKHELVFVFKVGTAEHTNTFGLGDTGRYRTNVWDYAGISSLGSNRAEELAMHPTVKPVSLVADAIRDCTKRGEIVLDAFGGSGTTMIAAETCGRKARLIEYDPAYCDTIITRWEKLTGKAATLLSERAGDGQGSNPGTADALSAGSTTSSGGTVETRATDMPRTTTVAITGMMFEEVAEARIGADWVSAQSGRGAIEPALRKEVRAQVTRRRTAR
jgi:DNA modification methylase